MLLIFGLVFTFAMVFGSFIISGGKFGIIAHAAPHELMCILGAGIGSFLMANKANIVKKTLKEIKKAGGNGRWNKQDFVDILTLLFAILKTVRSKGMIALEQHIENPGNSPLFSKYPRILKDHFAVDFICDTLRMMTMNLEDPHQVETVMENQLEKHHHEAMAPSEAIQALADATPAIGIVAAVLGVIKTMASIDQPVDVLGAMIGGALVGTFMGVFLAYCLFGPIASKLKQIVNQEHQFYLIVRDVLVAHLNGNAPQVSIEIGRGNVPSIYQPTFQQLEQTLSDVKAE